MSTIRLILSAVVASCYPAVPAGGQVNWRELEEAPAAKEIAGDLSEMNRVLEEQLSGFERFFTADAGDRVIRTMYGAAKNRYTAKSEDLLQQAGDKLVDENEKKPDREKLREFLQLTINYRSAQQQFWGEVDQAVDLKEAASESVDAWTALAGEIDTVLRNLREEMARNDQELKVLNGPGFSLKKLEALRRLDSVAASVRNCQSAATSRIAEIRKILDGAEIAGFEKGIAKLQAGLPAPDGDTMLPGYYWQALSGWLKVLQQKDLPRMKKARDQLAKAARPLLEQDLFNDLESFRPYKLDSVTEAVEATRKSFQ